MSGLPTDSWERELEGWLEPFLGRLRRRAQRHWAPFYRKRRLSGTLQAGRDPRPHVFSSLLSSFRKRQSVPWAMICLGLDLIIPASCRRSA